MNRKEIEQNIIQTISSLTSEITFFGLGGVVRGIVSAVAAAVDELFYDINRVKRSMFKATASGDDLENLGKDNNTSRLESAYAGVVLVFSGTAGTVVPAGTQVQGGDGVIFETVEAITLGSANTGYDFFPSEPLGDKVEAIATTPGTIGNVSAFTLISMVAPVSGVTDVTNPSLATGGVDAEPDNQYRVRLMERVNLLNQGTLAAYEALAREINEEALRVYSCRGSSQREVSLYVATRSGTALSSGDKTYLQESMKDYVPACVNPVVYDVTFTDIDIYAKVSLESGYTLQEVFDQMLINLADLVDWSKEDFGADVDYLKIREVCEKTAGVKKLDINSFLPAENIKCLANSLPKLNQLSLVNYNNTSESLNYSPNTTYIYSY